jgi:signal peptidase I
MLRVLKVTGTSLAPDYREGDFVLVAKIPFSFNPLHQGDTVVFRHADYGTLIKKIGHISTDGKEIYVIGTRLDSIDSHRIGPVQRRDLIGKVIWHIRR